MKDFMDNPQMKYLAEIIDAILIGNDLKEQDWNLLKTLTHLSHWTHPLILHFKILKRILTVYLLSQIVIGAVDAF